MLSPAEQIASRIRRQSPRPGEIVVRARRARCPGDGPRAEFDWDAETGVSTPDALTDWLTGLYNDAGEYLAVDVWIPKDRAWCQVTLGAQVGLAREIAKRAFNIAYAYDRVIEAATRA